MELERLSVPDLQALRSNTEADFAVLEAKRKAGDQLIKEASDRLKESMPRVCDVHEIAKRRQECNDRKYAVQRRILVLYGRFPGILSGAQFRGVDGQQLQAQLANTRKRIAEVEAAIEDGERNVEMARQRVVDLRAERGSEMDGWEERDRGKQVMIAGLRKELEAARTLYVVDRASVRKEKWLSQRNQELEPELHEARVLWGRLNQEAARSSGMASVEMAGLGQTLQARHAQLAQLVEANIAWWGMRRQNKYWHDKREFLLGVARGSNERRDSATRDLQKVMQEHTQCEAQGEEMASAAKALHDEVRERQGQLIRLRRLHGDLAARVGSRATYTDEQKAKIEELKRQATAKRAERDVWAAKVMAKSSDQGLDGDALFVRERREYWEQLKGVMELKREVAALRAQRTKMQEEHDEALREERTPVADARYGVDGAVQAMSIENLGRILYDPGNHDRLFIPGLLVLMHSDGQDLREYVNSLADAFEEAPPTERRQATWREAAQLWRTWFPDDLKEGRKEVVRRFFDLGVLGLQDMQSIPEPLKDPEVPVNLGEMDIAKCASPYILAEHFSFVELSLLRAIPASEFVGCGWTGLDKWVKSPNLMRLMEHFNLVSRTIVQQFSRLWATEEQCDLFMRWVDIMSAAADMGSFQLVFEIFSALCNPAVQCFQSMWVTEESKEEREKRERRGEVVVSAAHWKVWKDMRTLTSPSARFEEYRRRVAALPCEVVVPYIGPFLTGLVYIHDGNPSKKQLSPGEVVPSFGKFRSYAGAMQEIMRPWGEGLRFALNEQLLRRVKNLPPVDDSDSVLFRMADDRAKEVAKKERGEKAREKGDKKW